MDAVITNFMSPQTPEMPVTIWYDWEGGVQEVTSLEPTGDTAGAPRRVKHNIEFNNGTSFYYYETPPVCTPRTFPCGILRPDWLRGAEFLGTSSVGGEAAHVWRQADFVQYYSRATDGTPIFWDFLNGSGFRNNVTTFLPSEVPPKGAFTPPSYCFTRSVSSDS